MKIRNISKSVKALLIKKKTHNKIMLKFYIKSKIILTKNNNLTSNFKKVISFSFLDE